MKYEKCKNCAAWMPKHDKCFYSTSNPLFMFGKESEKECKCYREKGSILNLRYADFILEEYQKVLEEIIKPLIKNEQVETTLKC